MAVVEDCEGAADGGTFPGFELDVVGAFCRVGFGVEDGEALASADLEEGDAVVFGVCSAHCQSSNFS